VLRPACQEEGLRRLDYGFSLTTGATVEPKRSDTERRVH
jgi:hypothetical protein